MGLRFQPTNFAGTQFSPQQRSFRGNNLLGQTQVSKSQGYGSYACGKDQSYFYSVTQQVRVRAKRQGYLGCGETNKRPECQE